MFCFLPCLCTLVTPLILRSLQQRSSRVQKRICLGYPQQKTVKGSLKYTTTLNFVDKVYYPKVSKGVQNVQIQGRNNFFVCELLCLSSNTKLYGILDQKTFPETSDNPKATYESLRTSFVTFLSKRCVQSF